MTHQILHRLKFLSILFVCRFQDDDDKKNSICIPVDAPHDPVQWFETSYKANLNLEKLVYALGIRWMRTKRLSLMSHIGIVPCIKILFAMLWNKEKLNEKMKLFGTQREIYGKLAILSRFDNIIN